VKESPIIAILGELEALPEAKEFKIPFTKELAEADELHDGIGGAVWSITEAALRHPRLSKELKAAAGRIRDAFVPKLAELIATYQDEAARAKARRKQVAARDDDLRLFPVPGDPGHTLLDWVNDFLDQGEALDELMSQRATVTGEAGGEPGDRSAAMTLRARAIGIIGRCRGALADEASTNDSLPKNLDKLVFGYFDELAKARD